MSLLDPPFSRRHFLELKLGWLLADTLEGPHLVYRDRDVFRALELEALLPELRRRVAGGYKSIARAKSEGGRHLQEHRAGLARAIKQLRTLHRELVTLARGYAFLGLVHAASGLEFVCLFDEEAAALEDRLESGTYGRAVHMFYQYQRLELVKFDCVIPEERLDYGTPL